MSDLEARIAEVLAPLLYGEGRLQWERKWAEASPLVKSAWNVLAKEYAAALAPVIREREAEAWEEGHDSGDTYGYQRYGYERGYVDTLPEPTNPYRRSNDE